MSYKILARKYRPQSFEEVIGQEHITRTLKNAVEAKRFAQGYLFSGMRGVGKTTMARILAKALNCELGPTPAPCNKCVICEEITQGYSVDVLEIDGASNTSVDDIRELRENVLYAPARTRYKIYIIDEVHMLSKSAFNALLKTLEEPPPHVIFIFATTEAHKIPITIQSRCQCFHFRKIPLSRIVDQLLMISEKEGFSLDRDSAVLIGGASQGSMRDAQSLFDQVLSFSGPHIAFAETKLVLGVIEHEAVDECTMALISRDADRALNLVEKLYSTGVDLAEFCKSLLSHLRNLLMIKIMKDPSSVTPLSAEELTELKPIAQTIEEDRLMGCMEQIQKTEEEMRRSKHPKILLELACIKITRIEPLRDFKEILLRLESMEDKCQQADPIGNFKEKQRGSDLVEKRNQDLAQGGERCITSAAPLPWEKFVQHTLSFSPVVGAILEHAFLERLDPHSATIGFKKKIYYDMAREKKEQVLEILRDFTQQDLTLMFSLASATESLQQTLTEKKREQKREKKERIREENLGNHLVQQALRIFNGKILEVRDGGAEAQGR